MTDTMTKATIPLDEGRISVSDGVEGHYNWANTEEVGYRFIVRIGDHMLSEVVSGEDGASLNTEGWDDRIRFLVKESARWFGGGEQKRISRAAITEWIERDDPEDERLIAIETAEMKAHTAVITAQIHSAWHATEIVRQLIEKYPTITTRIGKQEPST
jgi:hypothetical protein